MIRYSDLTARGRMVVNILTMIGFLAILGVAGWIEGL